MLDRLSAGYGSWDFSSLQSEDVRREYLLRLLFHYASWKYAFEFDLAELINQFTKRLKGRGNG